jgi:hypothetical protein
MTENKSRFTNNKVLPILRYLLLIIALAYFMVYLWIAYNRIRFPFELSWIEGGMVDQVQRITSGKPVYVAPSINFVPFLYTPLYFYISALVSSLFGGGLFPLRMVSFTASLASLAAILMIVRDETKNWWAALLSVSLFTATYRLSGSWLDVARVDSLFLAFWLWLIFLIRTKKTYLNGLFASILTACAFLTKQTAIFACLPIIAYLFRWYWKYALTILTVAMMIIGITTLVMNQASNGWYTYYVFRLLLQQKEWLPLKTIIITTIYYYGRLLLAILIGGYFMVIRSKKDQYLFFLWLSILISAMATTFMTGIKVGADVNAYIPIYAIISILFGLGLNELLKRKNQLPTSPLKSLEVVILFACFSQFFSLHSNPHYLVPTDSDLRAWNGLVKLISEVDGEVYIPDHGYISSLAGKNSYAHTSAIWDVVRRNNQSLGKELLMESLNYSIRHQYFDMIILDPVWNFCCREIDEYYVKEGEIFKDTMITGWTHIPTYIYIAKRLK